MSFKQGSIIDKNTAQTILKAKNESYKKIRSYYQSELDKHEKEYSTKEWMNLRTEFEKIDLNDPNVYYRMGRNTNKPVYEYLTELSPYYEKKYFLIGKIEQLDKIIGGVNKEEMHDELLKKSYKKYADEFYDIIYGVICDDFIDKVELGVYGTQCIGYNLDRKVYYNVSLNIPQDVNSLRDAMVSFKFGDFSTFIDINGKWDMTINYISKDSSLHPIYYSEKHMFY